MYPLTSCCFESQSKYGQAKKEKTKTYSKRNIPIDRLRFQLHSKYKAWDLIAISQYTLCKMND